MKERILSYLPPRHPWRNSILWFDSIGSTNTTAKELAAAGAPHGTVLLADSQYGGRGRLGRTFQSPPGSGIYMSVILRPQCEPGQLMHLTCAVAVAMCDAVEQAIGFRPSIKWINDLVANKRKLGGILTELSISPKTGLVDYAVIGIGINCSQKAEDFPEEIREIACSAAMLIGHTVDRPLLAASMITALEVMSRELLTAKDRLMEKYRDDCVTIGSEVTVLRSDTARNGFATDIDNDGALIVRYPNGTQEAVNSGEVSVRGLYGYT